MGRFVEYRCLACGAVDEIEVRRDQAPEERWGFCECRRDGKPVKKRRVEEG